MNKEQNPIIKIRLRILELIVSDLTLNFYGFQ